MLKCPERRNTGFVTVTSHITVIICKQLEFYFSAQYMKTSIADHFIGSGRAIEYVCLPKCPENNFWTKWAWIRYLSRTLILTTVLVQGQGRLRSHKWPLRSRVRIVKAVNFSRSGLLLRWLCAGCAMTDPAFSPRLRRIGFFTRATLC